MARDAAFEGNIKLVFKNGGKSEEIENTRINYVMIEYRYECVNILPVIYVGMNVPSDLYTSITKNYKSAKFYLKIRKKNFLSKSAVYIPVLEDEFSYITSTTNVNFTESLNSKRYANREESYRNITIGLVSIDMTNKLRQSFNGIYNNVDSNKLVSLALEGLGKVVKENLHKNHSFESIVIPPQTSRYKMLNFIFDKGAFYNSFFTFFMDFNGVTYLLSKSPKGTGYEGGKNVIVKVEKADSENAFEDGFSKTNGAFVIHVNGNDVNMVINEATEKVVNNLSAFDEDKGLSNAKLSLNNTDQSSTKTNFLRSSDPGVMKSEMETNAVMLEVMRSNLDSSILVPNNSFFVSNIGSYSKYNGTYILSSKREFYTLSEPAATEVLTKVGTISSSHARFLVTNTFSLKKINNNSLEK